MTIINLGDKELPEQWEITKLPDFTNVVMGQSPLSETYNLDKNGLPFFQGKTEFGAIYPKINKYCSKPNKIAEEGATLLSVRAPVGPTNLAKTRCCIGRGLAAIHPIGGVDPKFIFLLLRSIELNLAGEGTGSTFKAITKAYVDELTFAVPPLNEQKRIVAKIEELFSELDNGIAALKTAREQFKVYRKALLKHAFEGKLTAKWREENTDKLETPEQLLASIQQERNKKLQELAQEGDNEARRYLSKIEKAKVNHSEKKLNISAKWVSLIEICTLIVDCHNKTAPYENQGIWLIRTPCVKDGKIFLNEEARFISEETYEYWAKRCPPKAGDIIFTREAPMGEVCVVPENTRICMGQRMMLLRPPRHLTSKYLLYSMMEPSFQSRMNATAVGTGVKHLRVGDVEKLCIPLFSQAEQSVIIDILDSKLSVVEVLEKEVENSLNKSETLRQSILKNAFSGNLVPQDPNDEPASELLERIKAEKEQKKAAAKKLAIKPSRKKVLEEV